MKISMTVTQEQMISLQKVTEYNALLTVISSITPTLDEQDDKSLDILVERETINV